MIYDEATEIEDMEEIAAYHAEEYEPPAEQSEYFKFALGLAEVRAAEIPF